MDLVAKHVKGVRTSFYFGIAASVVFFVLAILELALRGDSVTAYAAAAAVIASVSLAFHAAAKGALTELGAWN